LRLGVKKALSSVFESVKISVQHWTLFFIVNFYEYEVGTKCNNHVAIIGAPEVILHDVKHV